MLAESTRPRDGRGEVPAVVEPEYFITIGTLEAPIFDDEDTLASFLEADHPIDEYMLASVYNGVEASDAPEAGPFLYRNYIHGGNKAILYLLGVNYSWSPGHVEKESRARFFSSLPRWPMY
jgi:hypothetical protein